MRKIKQNYNRQYLREFGSFKCLDQEKLKFNELNLQLWRLEIGSTLTLDLTSNVKNQISGSLGSRV